MWGDVGACSQGQVWKESRAQAGATGSTDLRGRGRGALREMGKEKEHSEKRKKARIVGSGQGGVRGQT